MLCLRMAIETGGFRHDWEKMLTATTALVSEQSARDNSTSELKVALFEKQVLVGLLVADHREP